MQLVAKDSSGMGNDLPLVSPPERSQATVQGVRLLKDPQAGVCMACGPPAGRACICGHGHQFGQ